MSAARDKTHEPRPNEGWMTIDPRPIPALLKLLTPRGQIWECACGTGEMARRLEAAGYAVFGTDISNGDHFDFLKCAALPDARLRTIITNPPNTLNLAFALHALDLLRSVDGLLALYQRHEWDTTKESAAVFDHPAYAYKITCRFRPKWVEHQPGGKRKSPFHRWSWYVWDWTHAGQPLQKFA